jgi:acetyl-CoA C-acetyltransferase
LWDVYSDQHMGMTGELVADEYGISREMQDTFAAASHRKASEAWESGRFQEETFDVVIPQRRGDPLVLRQDEGFRADVTAESLDKLRPAFKKDGSVTAGNASQISDGASALLVASEKAVKEYGLTPMAEITGYAAGGMAPEWVMMAPKSAMQNLEKVTGISVQDYALLEINEAFASGACALLKTLVLDSDKVNVNGGAIALGHPIGASGARILTTLLYAMKDRGVQTGAATLCLGGGNAVALSVQAC